jgi:hypothetical protein
MILPHAQGATIVGQQGVLQGHGDGPEDQGASKADPENQGQDPGTDRKPYRHNRRFEGKGDRDGHPSLEQEHQDEEAAGALGQGLDGVVKIDAVEGAVAEQGLQGAGCPLIAGTG